MEKREKVDFLLEQMRLCLDNKDFIRAQIMSNKINRKILNEADCQDLKLRFYQQMIRYYAHETNFLEICKSYQSIYDTPNVKADKAQWTAALQKIVLYLMFNIIMHFLIAEDMLYFLPMITPNLTSYIAFTKTRA